MFSFTTIEPTLCECGAVADAPLTVYNGMYDLDVCHACWMSPETIATEALVNAAGADVWNDNVVLGAIDVECAARSIAPTISLTTLVLARRAEWY